VYFKIKLNLISLISQYVICKNSFCPSGYNFPHIIG